MVKVKIFNEENNSLREVINTGGRRSLVYDKDVDLIIKSTKIDNEEFKSLVTKLVTDGEVEKICSLIFDGQVEL